MSATKMEKLSHLDRGLFAKPTVLRKLDLIAIEILDGAK